MTARPFVSRTANGFWRVFYQRDSQLTTDYYTNHEAAMKAAQRLAAKGAAWH